MTGKTIPILQETHVEHVEVLHKKVSAHPKWGEEERFKQKDMLARFLIARQHDVEHAYAMWEQWVEWRVAAKPHAVTKDDVQHLLDTGLTEIEGKDKNGRPVVVLRPRHHHSSAFPLEDVIKLAYFQLERSSDMSREMEGGDGRIVVIWEHSGASMKNWDTALFINKPGLIQILKDYYPECLAGLYIVNANWLFRMFWKVISPFIDERTKTKVKIVASPSELLDDFHKHDLPSDVRGMVDDDGSSSSRE